MNRSPRKSAIQWAELVSEYTSGQESERDFCARHGVKLATLRKWRTHFKARDKQAANPAPTSAFVKVNVQQRPVSNDAAVLHIGNSVYVFTNRARNKIKLLVWHLNGYWVLYKSIEKQRFHWPDWFTDDCMTMDQQQLDYLIDGYNLNGMRPHKVLSFTRAF